MSAATREEIQRYQDENEGGVTAALLLGGVDAVSEQVAEELRSLGLEVECVEGGERVATAVASARLAFPPNDRGAEVPSTRCSRRRSAPRATRRPHPLMSSGRARCRPRGSVLSS